MTPRKRAPNKPRPERPKSDKERARDTERRVSVAHDRLRNALPDFRAAEKAVQERAVDAFIEALRLSTP